jgi:hypothetical protein
MVYERMRNKHLQRILNKAAKRDKTLKIIAI